MNRDGRRGWRGSGERCRVRTGDHVGGVRGEVELRLEVLGQKRVDAGQRQQVEHAARGPVHEHFVLQQPFDRGREPVEPGRLGGRAVHAVHAVAVGPRRRVRRAGPAVGELFLSRRLGRRRRRRRRTQPFGEREHEHGGHQQRGRDADQAQPPGAHPARVVGVHVGLGAEVGVQAGAERAQQEAERRAQYAHADGDGEVQRRLAAGHVVVDERYAQRVHGRLGDAHAQQAGEEYGQHDVRVLRLLLLLGQRVLLARLPLAARRRPRARTVRRRVLRRHAHVGRVVVVRGRVGRRRRPPRQRVLVVAEQEVRRRARERGHPEQHHAASDPPRPVALSAVVREQQRRADLPDLRGAQHDAHRLALQLEQLLQRGDHAHEVRGEHALQHPAEAERGQEHLLRSEHLHPLGPARPDAALRSAAAAATTTFSAPTIARRHRVVVAATAVHAGRGQHGVRLLGPVSERGHVTATRLVRVHSVRCSPVVVFSAVSSASSGSTGLEQSEHKNVNNRKSSFDFETSRTRRVAVKVAVAHHSIFSVLLLIRD